jgi:hypothetical protein
VGCSSQLIYRVNRRGDRKYPPLKRYLMCRFCPEFCRFVFYLLQSLLHWRSAIPVHIIRVHMKRALESPHPVFHEHHVQILLNGTFCLIELEQIRREGPVSWLLEQSVSVKRLHCPYRLCDDLVDFPDDPVTRVKLGLRIGLTVALRADGDHLVALFLEFLFCKACDPPG